MIEQEKEWVLIDPPTLLPCALGVIAPSARVEEIAKIEHDNKVRRFVIRAILSDHIPLAGTITDILNRPSYQQIIVNSNKITIYLHHGGQNAIFYDLLGEVPKGLLDYIEVHVETKYPSNCFWSARTAVSELLDSIIRSKWLPLTITRLDLHLDGDSKAICHQIVLPFKDGLKLGPLGGIHQFPFMVAYEALIREAITTGSPYYRVLCGYRLYEGINPLRKKIKNMCNHYGIKAQLPKPQDVDMNFLRNVGFTSEFLSNIKNVDDFCKKTSKQRDAIAHFLLRDLPGPISLSDGATYHQYSLLGAVLIHYSHIAIKDLFNFVIKNFTNQLFQGSILPEIERRDDFILKPDSYLNIPGK